MGVIIFAIIKIYIEILNFSITPTLFNFTTMDEFEDYSVEIDSELIGQDLDNIDPYAEFTNIEEDDFDDGGILYE